MLGILKQVFAEWNQDKVPRLSAALAYYTVFSLAPLLVVLIAIVGFVYGQQAAQNQIQGQIQGVVGQDAAGLIQTMIKNTGNKTSGGIISTIIGIGTLLFGAIGLFGQLKDSLNTIWGVQPPNRGVWGFVKSEALSFLALLGTGLLLIAALLLSTVLATVGGLISSVIPFPPILLTIASYALSFAIITLLFAMIYKVLPDAEIRWRDVWVGALITAVLFTIGEIADRHLLQHRRRRLDLRRRRLADHPVALGLLLRHGPLLRRRANAGLRPTGSAPRWSRRPRPRKATRRAASRLSNRARRGRRPAETAGLARRIAGAPLSGATDRPG